MANVKQEVLQQLDKLITEGLAICKACRVHLGARTPICEMPEYELRGFAVRAYAAIERIAGRDSEYYKHLPRDDYKGLLRSNEGPSRLTAMHGALTALREAVESGFLVSLETRIREYVHDDFLQQARDLLDSNPPYHVAAMVLIGGVLEDHLKKLCTKHVFTWNGSGSISKYNDACKQGGTYDQSTWRRIQSLGDLRNEAAHGQGANVKADDVEDAHKFTGRFLADYPA